jgi:hypothetical protein
MTAMPLTLSPTIIAEANHTARKHVDGGHRRVGFALRPIGHLFDSIGGHVVEKLNIRLERDLVRIRGIASLVPDLDPCRVLDPHNRLAEELADLQRHIHGLHGKALRARDEIKLRRTHDAFRACVELCVVLYEAVGEFKKAIAAHDSKAAIGDDARRLLADLKRADDIPAGRYAELAAVLRRIPERSVADNGKGPAPL